MNYSEEQKRVIEARGGNILVSAAAGSGKTAVLVERIIQILTDPDEPVGVDRLIVMTFTRAAAAELRSRVQEALGKKLSEAPDDPWLRTQRALLPRARICTIDSLCQQLVRMYYQKLDIDPGFRVADDGELRLLRADVFEELLEEEYAKGGEDFLRFARRFGGSGNSERLSGIVEKMFFKAQAEPWPERWLREQKEIAESEIHAAPEALPWTAELFDGMKEEARSFYAELTEALTDCEAPDGPYIYLEQVRADLAAAQALLSAASFAEVQAVLETTAFPALSRATKGMDPVLRACVKGILDRFKKYLTEKLPPVFGYTDEEAKNINAESARGVKQLLSLTEEFSIRFRGKKRERNIIDFSDMEHLALELLYEEGEDGRMRPNALADELAEGLYEIMIDEYQDSNYVQEALIGALSAERLGRPDVFMVGDVKQSIYRFRNACHELFLEKYHTYGNGGESRLFELNRNYRSRAEVVDCVNSLFTGLMTGRLGGVAYDGRAALHQGASYEPVQGAEAELWLSEKPEEKEPGKDPEYRFIARRIRELTGALGPEKRFFVTDRETKTLRPCRFGDIAVLIRSAKGRGEELADLLRSQGIPAVFEGSQGFFDAPEVRTVLSLLAVIDNPRQDINLAAALRSPAGGFTDSELAAVRILGDRKAEGELRKPGDLYSALLAAAEEEGPLSGKCRAFLTSLSRWRFAADALPVHRLLGLLYRETGCYERAGAMPFGKIRRKNLDMLLKRAEDYGATSYRGLFDFVRYIEMLKKYDTDYSEAQGLSDSDDVVRIGTVHGAKGLEYPVVFISKINTRFNFRDLNSDAFLYAEGLGAACDAIDLETRVKSPGIKKQLIRKKERESALSEEMRLLYVAVTRAREKLILTASVDPEEDGKKETDRKGTAALCWLDWILSSEAAKAGGCLSPLRITEEMLGECERKEEAGEQEALTSLLSEDPLKTVLPEFKAFLSRGMDTVLSFGGDEALRPKLSVSELKKAAAEKRFLASRPVEEEPSGEFALTEDGGLERRPEPGEGAERGTVFHKLLELLDLERLKEGEEVRFLEEELGRLAAEDLFSEEDKAALRMDEVKQFLKGRTASGMAEAARRGQLFREQHFMIGLPARELTEGTESGSLQLLQGIIDAYYFTADGEIVLIDYKTDRVKRSAVLVERYEEQLLLYKRALTQLTGRPVREVLIWSSALGREIPL